jgi:transposase
MVLRTMEKKEEQELNDKFEELYHKLLNDVWEISNHQLYREAYLMHRLKKCLESYEQNHFNI